MSVIWIKTAVTNVAILALTACTNGDLDLRGLGDGFETTSAARQTTQNRPRPDDRGVISYPNYQVAVAKRGDTVTDVAARVGLDAAELASYNGLSADTSLRKDEVLALPRRVDLNGNVSPVIETLPAEERVDIAAIATTALDRAPQDPDPDTSITPVAATGPEPIRHRVAAGETAYSISRLHGVSVRSLAEWNGLDRNFTLREGQFLLIPVRNAPVRSPVTAPGTGSPTPTPPSSTRALPKDSPAPTTPSSPILSASATVASDTSKFLLPTSGRIIRPFIKGKNDGIQIAADAGTPVKAADKGTVAAITRDIEQVPILVLRHEDNILTVYANIADIIVEKGDAVARGQKIAEVRNSSPSFLEFQVRDGFASVDPTPYLE